MSALYPSSVQATGDGSFNNQPIGFRNRVINGAMRIDQRNVGAAVSLNSAAAYVTDRWFCNNTLSMTSTFQQGILGSSGFPSRISGVANTNCLTWVNSSTASTTTASAITLLQHIEGNTVIDLGWGFTGAKAVTLSFWVYASVAGVYSLALQNNDSSLNYIATYSISVANTWQKIALTIGGATTGTWTTDTTTGINLLFNLNGSTASGSTSNTGSWQTTNVYIASTQTNLASTASSTFSLTGIQLEIGLLPTPFEWRPYETEMRMCQRYYEKSWDYGTAVGTNTNSGIYFGTAWSSANVAGFQFRVEKRIIPLVVAYNPNSTTPNNIVLTGGSANVAVTSYSSVSTKTMGYFNATVTSGSVYYWQFTANADY